MVEHKNQLLQLVPDRVKGALKRLNDQIWEKIIPLDVFVGPLSDGFISLEEVFHKSFSRIQPGEYFSNPDWKSRWFRITIPQAAADQKGRRYLFWDVNGETTVFILGEPWCGLDVAHPSCPLPDEACTLYLDCGVYQTAIWMLDMDERLSTLDNHGLKFRRAKIRVRNELAWETKFDLEVLVQVMNYQLEKIG